MCREREIAFVPFFPLGSAFTGGPQKLAGDPALSSVANKHGVTPSQVALAWLLARYDWMLLISGTTSVAHLEENLAAGGLELDDQDMAVLDDVTQEVRRALTARTRRRDDPRRQRSLPSAGAADPSADGVVSSGRQLELAWLESALGGGQDLGLITLDLVLAH